VDPVDLPHDIIPQHLPPREVVCPTSVVVTNNRYQRRDSSVNDIPAPVAMSEYSLIAACAASVRYR